jgi:hypothetical protein
MLSKVLKATYRLRGHCPFTIHGERFKSRFLNLGSLQRSLALSGVGWGEFGLLPFIHFQC